MNAPKESYPLSWPAGWPRTLAHKIARSKFGGSLQQSASLTLTRALDAVLHELALLGAGDPIVSTNFTTRLDGQPRGGQAQPKDKGAAVYFSFKKRPTVLACDRWDKVEHNLWAIAKHVEALRGQDRWGVGSLEQAFAGYLAIPAKTGGDDPWAILGLPVNFTEESLKEAYRLLAKKFHPDNPDTGDAERFARIRSAYDMLAQNLRSTRQGL
ncbi:MAG: hypothetical protein JWQ04_648 [Pedosphaera sp.]|nr:hypothetical protein [Pedosphaera sp.]